MAAERGTPFAAGARLELTVGAVAHGGHCVARVGDDPHGRVVFVRHALPGERVVANVTEDDGGAYCRADAIEIVRAAPGRVAPPCLHAGAGRCGGCDWQHVDAATQRDLKAAVVAEQFARLAGMPVAVTVEELPGGPLGWRTRTVYATAPDGSLGLRRHRSHDVEVLDRCPLGVPGVGDSPALAERWTAFSGLEVARGDDDGITWLGHLPAPRPSSGRGAGARTRHRRRPPDVVRVERGTRQLTHTIDGRQYRVASAGFWQVHPFAAPTFASAMLAALEPVSGDVVLDLYAGAGLFTALFGARVGATGRVAGVESDREAVTDAQQNAADQPWTQIVRGRVTAEVVAEHGRGADLVILDPPRAGAGAEVVRSVLALRPRRVGYLACDPASLARDVATAADQGWTMASLRAFDAFPMTHHVECLAVLEPPPG